MRMFFTCADDDSARDVVRSRDSLQLVPVPLLPPASLLQRLRKRRCFADIELERWSLDSERLLVAVNQKQQPADTAAAAAEIDSDVITTSRDTVSVSTLDRGDSEAESHDQRPKTDSKCRLQSDDTPGYHVDTPLQCSDDCQASVVVQSVNSGAQYAVASIFSSCGREKDVCKTTTASLSASPSSSSSAPSLSRMSKASLSFSVETLLAK